MIQISIPILSVSVEVFLAALSVFLVWILYRVQQWDEKKRIMNSLGALIDYAGEWFNGSYDEYSCNPAWFDPSKSVYPVDIIQVPNIINSNLVSPDLTKQLSFFIELVRRFNHRIEVFNSFVYSDPKILQKSLAFYLTLSDNEKNSYIKIREKIEVQDEEIQRYLNHIYFLQKIIHTDGIGNNSSYNEKFPMLHKCFIDIKTVVEHERKIKNNLFRGRWYFILFDLMFFCIPLFLIVLFATEFIVKHIKVTSF